MQEQIVTHLKEVYRPDAIILHGSRARNKEREHSDWDFIFLYTKLSESRDGRMMLDGQNIEFTVHELPIEDVLGEFSTKLQGALVLYEKNHLATNLILRAKTEYEKGVHWTPEWINDHRLWFEGRLNGMRDNIDNAMLFQKYFADLYARIFNYWYWVKKLSHSQPTYIAGEEVAYEDPQYFALVQEIAGESTSLQRKVEIAEQIKEYLFIK